MFCIPWATFLVALFNIFFFLSIKKHLSSPNIYIKWLAKHGIHKKEHPNSVDKRCCMTKSSTSKALYFYPSNSRLTRFKNPLGILMILCVSGVAVTCGL